VLECIKLRNIQYEYRTNQYTKTNILIIMKAWCIFWSRWSHWII